MSNKQHLYVFDVDGTLTAEPYAADDVVGLRVNYPVATLCRVLYQAGHLIDIVTARPASLEADTVTWLQNNKIPYHSLTTRAQGDERPDYQVRVDQVRIAEKRHGVTVDTVFDDNVGNIQELTKHGYNTAKVHIAGYGNG
jgi:uncharacterized HAD superfamily protein